MVQYCYLLEGLTGDDLRKNATGPNAFDSLKSWARKIGTDAYLQKRRGVEEVQPGLMAEAERYFLLTQTDNLWKEHLQSINFLRQAVGLRGYAQKDPLTEYKLEGYQLFLDMTARIRRNVIYNVFQFEPLRVVSTK